MVLASGFMDRFARGWQIVWSLSCVK